MSKQEKKEISAVGKWYFPFVGSLIGTLKMGEDGSVSVSAAAKANIYTGEAYVKVDEDKNVIGGGMFGINFNPFAELELNFNVDKYCKLITGVCAKFNIGLISMRFHAEIGQNGQNSAGFDIHSSFATNESIGYNVEMDTNGEMSHSSTSEKGIDGINVFTKEKFGKPNFSRSTNPENEGQGERSGDFGGSIKIGDTNYQLDFSQPTYWSYLGQNTKLGNLGPKLWTYGRSGDVGSKSLNLSNFCQYTKLENLETEHWTHGRSEDVASSGDNIGDTKHQTDFMDKLMQSNFGKNTKLENLGTEHFPYGRSDGIVSSGDKIGDTNNKADFLDTFMRARDDKFSGPIILSNLDQNTKPINVRTEHLTYGRSDEVGSYFMGNFGTELWTHERRYDVGGIFQGFGSRSPFTLSTQKSG